MFERGIKGKLNIPVSTPKEEFARSTETLATYLLLTEFKGRTVNYGPRFSPSIYGPSPKHAGHKSKGKNKVP